MLYINGQESGDRMAALAPLKRGASPDEMASTILFLASEKGSFYTGQTLSPNGGAV